jgi:phosphatidate cytidylyltransferase
LILVFLLLVFLRFESLTWLIGVFALALAAAGTYEILRMGQQKGLRPSIILGVAAAAAYVIAAFFSPGVFLTSAVVITFVLLVFAFLVHIATQGIEDAYRSIPLNVFAPIYVGLPLAAGLQVLWADRILLLYLLLLVWTLDSAAYYVGRRYGRTKLAPALSPNKTREGALGGLAGVVVLGLLLKLLIPASAFVFGWGDVLLTALLIGVFGQLGDLAESALKRDAGVKDSGVALTGHGGVLDRVDSLLFVLPLFYVYLLATGRIVPFGAALLGF